jgi:single-stranded DNA-binding protein
MESKMMNIAEFTILGRVGKIKPFDGKTNVTICANYTFRNRDSAAHWNEVTIFAEATRGYIANYCKEGDLVIARGRIKQTSFTRNGSTVYGVDLLADEFSVLASKTERAEPAPADPAPKAYKPKSRTK